MIIKESVTRESITQESINRAKPANDKTEKTVWQIHYFLQGKKEKVTVFFLEFFIIAYWRIKRLNIRHIFFRYTDPFIPNRFSLLSI